MRTADWRRIRRAQHPYRPGPAVRRAVTLVSGACLVVTLSSCGNWISVTQFGHVGITVDAAGQPVVEVMTCSKATPVIDMYEGRKKSDPGNKENVQRGLWQARRGFTGVQQFALNAPGKNWKTTNSPGPLEPDRLFLLGGGVLEKDDGNLVGVDFRAADLAPLSAGEILVNDYDDKTGNQSSKIVSLREFAAYKCD
jgi:hypothetical protein